MSLISVNDLTFCYDGSYDAIFEHASFELDTDWRLGFVGRNGRGKTTFLNLLLGKYEYKGSIHASVRFTYFPFSVADPARDTIDVLAEATEGAPEWKLLRELGRMGMDVELLYRPFETLSPGERTRALLAALFLRENNFLLIDEPTNHLDVEGRALLRDYLRTKKGFILVSHDRAFLDGCVDHILSINRANITVTRGNFSTWWENKARQDAYELAENERLMGDIRRLRNAAQQSSAWADRVEATKIGGAIDSADRMKNSRSYVAAQSAKMQQRRKNLERRQQNAIEEKSGLLKNIERNDALLIHPLSYRKEVVAEVRELAVRYGGAPVFEGLSFEVRQGMRLALTGYNGSGKSSVVKLLAGEPIPHTGLLRMPGDLIVSYVPQDTSFLKGDLREFAQRSGIDESLFKTILRKLDFPRVQFEKDMANFSAGQRKKVLLARSLCERAHLYLWDEPLNYVDVLSRMQIEALLSTGNPSMVFVEHDAKFLEDIATDRIRIGG